MMCYSGHLPCVAIMLSKCSGHALALSIAVFRPCFVAVCACDDVPPDVAIDIIIVIYHGDVRSFCVLLRDMTDPLGDLYSAEDADSFFLFALSGSGREEGGAGQG